MPKVEKTITINALPDKVFAYINDWKRNLEWWPSLVKVEDVTRQGAGCHFRWTFKIAGLLLHGETEVVEYIPSERLVTQTKGGGVSTWTYVLRPHEGGTELGFSVEYTIPIPVLGKMVEILVLRQNERLAELGLANLKDLMES